VAAVKQDGHPRYVGISGVILSVAASLLWTKTAANGADGLLSHHGRYGRCLLFPESVVEWKRAEGYECNLSIILTKYETNCIIV